MSHLVDDLDLTVAAALDSLGGVVDRDWDVPATNLDWSCYSTLEHVADDLLGYAGQVAVRTPQHGSYVPFDYFSRRPDADETAVHVDEASGNAGMLRVIDACGGILSAVARSRPADVRGYHPFGDSDPAGFAAMGTVETLLHLYDVSGPLGFGWDPDRDVVRRVLERLFPDASSDGDPWQRLLVVSGRTRETSGRPWRWDSSVR